MGSGRKSVFDGMYYNLLLDGDYLFKLAPATYAFKKFLVATFKKGKRNS